MIVDHFSGLHSTTDLTAVRCFETAVQIVAAHRCGAGDALDDALMLQPDLIAAHALKGFASVLLARAELRGPAQAHYQAARAALARAESPSESERALVESLELAIRGRLLAAAARLERHLATHANDFLALKLAHAMRFMGGDLAGMLRTTSAVLPEWEATRPGAGFVYGCHAFALEEAGSYEAAERLGREAFRIEPTDAWGLHAVSHVYEMQGRLSEGVMWLESTRKAWTRCNNFSFHVAWHLALLYLEAGDGERALQLYDCEVRSSSTDDFRDVSNASSLLWRLSQFGLDVGDRWEELGLLAKRRAGDTTLVFASLFHLLSALGAGDQTTASHILAALEQCSPQDGREQSGVAASIGAELARVMMGMVAGGADVGGDFARLARALPQIGGSNAQRDIFLRMLALIAADRGDRRAFERVTEMRNRHRRSDRLGALAAARLVSAERRIGERLCVA